MCIRDRAICHLRAAAQVVPHKIEARRLNLRHHRPQRLPHRSRHLGGKILRSLRLERGGLRIFQRHSRHHANFSATHRLTGTYQCLLLPVLVLERVVSEIPCQGVVHAVPHHPGLPVAVAWLLCLRRLVCHRMAVELAHLRHSCMLCGSPTIVERPQPLFQSR